jgi:hypothetical protein
LPASRRSARRSPYSQSWSDFESPNKTKSQST